MSTPVTQCFCIWSDLLGFGRAFENGRWNFDNKEAFRNIARLRMLEKVLWTSNDPSREVALVLNDGMARVYDLDGLEGESNQFLMWLHSSIRNHWIVNALDRQHGSPGLRSVLSFGERIKTWRGNRTWGDHIIIAGSKEVRRLADKKVCIYSPEEFQLNLAFSKAYLLESLGAKHGLSGPNLYLDVCALGAIRQYLTSSKFLRVVDIEDEADRAQGGPSVDPVSYRVEETRGSSLYRYEIFRAHDEHEVQLLAIEFFGEPIIISHRGIDTSLWRVKRYQPLDEKEPFYFDFEDYRFVAPKSDYVAG